MLGVDAESLEAPHKGFFGHRDILTESRARYEFVLPYLKRGAFLDIGCGRGYGFSVVREVATSLAGVDISEDFLKVAREENPDAEIYLSSAEELPFESDSFDSILSFEVIEHIDDDLAFLDEIVRVAKSGARVVISTPNILIASPGRSEPLNKFHVREYTYAQLRALLEKRFQNVQIFGQLHKCDLNDANVEEDSRKGFWGAVIDRIPMRVKYLIPAMIQDMLSVSLRPPLRVEDLKFIENESERSSNFVAIMNA